jgi:hypothetical protein
MQADDIYSGSDRRQLGVELQASIDSEKKHREGYCVTICVSTAAKGIIRTPKFRDYQ